MSLEFVRRWYNKIPPAERHLPILYYKGQLYSPNDILREVSNGTRLGAELQAKLEKLHSASSFGFDDIKGVDYVAKKRVEEVLKNLPPNFTIAVATNGQKVYLTKEELLKSPLIQKVIEEEKRKVIKLLGGAV